MNYTKAQENKGLIIAMRITAIVCAVFALCMKFYTAISSMLGMNVFAFSGNIIAGFGMIFMILAAALGGKNVSGIFMGIGAFISAFGELISAVGYAFWFSPRIFYQLIFFAALVVLGIMILVKAARKVVALVAFICADVLILFDVIPVIANGCGSVLNSAVTVFTWAVIAVFVLFFYMDRTSLGAAKNSAVEYEPGSAQHYLLELRRDLDAGRISKEEYESGRQQVLGLLRNKQI